MNRPTISEREESTRSIFSLFDLFFRSRRARRVQAARDQRINRKRPLFESLEGRVLLSADVAAAFQGVDGMLASVQSGLSDATNTSLPLIGNQLSSAASTLNDTIAAIRDNVTGKIADAVLEGLHAQEERFVGKVDHSDDEPMPANFQVAEAPATPAVPAPAVTTEPPAPVQV